MKVLQVITHLSTGGAEKLFTDMVPLIQEQKIEVDILILKKRKTFFLKKLTDAFNGNIRFLTSNSVYNPFLVFKIIPIMKKYDIIHVHLFPASYWIALALTFVMQNKPMLILTEHSTFNKRRNKWYFRGIEKFIYSRYTSVVSISTKTQESLLSWLNINDKEHIKFKVIENGIKIDNYINAIPYEKRDIAPSIMENHIILCMVGNFSIQKDQSTIIKAMKYLPAKTHLVLVGDGKLKSENRNLAVSLGVEKRVHFLGIRNDVERIIKTIDIMILSSRWEGFGLAAVEGMSAGKPVIASNVPGLSEVVDKAGLLFEKGNVNELVDLIELLINDQKFRNDTVKKCFSRARQFDVNIMVEKHIALYKSLIA